MLLFLMQFQVKLFLYYVIPAHHINADQQPLNCDILFIGDINIVQDKCSNRYIRIILCRAQRSFGHLKNIEWKKV